MTKGLLKRRSDVSEDADPNAWIHGRTPDPPPTRYKYYAYARDRGVRWRRQLPWLLLLLPGGVVAWAVTQHPSIWKGGHERGDVPRVQRAVPGTFTPRAAGPKVSPAVPPTASAAPGIPGTVFVPSASSLASVPGVPATLQIVRMDALLHREAVLVGQIRAILRGGVTVAERARLWQLRLALARTRRLILKERIRAVGTSDLKQLARLEALLARVNKQIALLRQINRLFRHGLTAREQTTLTALTQQLKVLNSSPLQVPATPTLPLPGQSVSTLAAPQQSSGVLGATFSATTATPTPSASASTHVAKPTASSSSPASSPTRVSTPTAATSTASPGNSAFGHSRKHHNKKPKH